MEISHIIKHNSQTFLDDLKKVTAVKVRASETDSFFDITKKSLISEAEKKAIKYFMSENIYPPGYTMVVI